MKKNIRLLLLPICLLTSCGKSTGVSPSNSRPISSTLSASDHSNLSTSTKKEEDEPLVLIQTQYYVKKNKSGRLDFSLNGCESKDLSFKSKNESIVSVDNDGNFTGHHYGSAIIEISVFDKVYEARVTVYNQNSVLGRWNYFDDEKGFSGTFEFSDIEEDKDTNRTYYHLNVEKYIGNIVDHYDFEYWASEGSDGTITIGSQIMDPWVEKVVSSDRNDVYLDDDPYVNYVSTYINVDSVDTAENKMSLYMGVQIGFDSIDPQDRVITWNAIFGEYTNQPFFPYKCVTFTRE